MQKVELNQLPQELRRAVEGDLAHNEGCKLLGCNKWDSTPWKDKTIVDTIYKAYTECENVLTVHTFSFGRIRLDSMMLGDISYFIKNSNLV
jgi:hypothetical protein